MKQGPTKALLKHIHIFNTFLGNFPYWRWLAANLNPIVLSFTTHSSKVIHVVILEWAGGRRRGRQRVIRRLGVLQHVPASQAEPQLSAELGLVDSCQLVGSQQALAHVPQGDVDGHWRRAAELRTDGMTEILEMERKMWENVTGVWYRDNFQMSCTQMSSPFPVTTPTKHFLLTGWWLPDWGAPVPVRARWRRWRRTRGRPLRQQRSRVPPRYRRGRCPTAPRNGTPHQTRWGPSLDPRRWEVFRTPHRRGWECGTSGMKMADGSQSGKRRREK